MKYRIHWWYDDMGSWEIHPADSEEARDFMQDDPEVELDEALVARYKAACEEYSAVCESIRQERDRQVVYGKDRRWKAREDGE